MSDQTPPPMSEADYALWAGRGETGGEGVRVYPPDEHWFEATGHRLLDARLVGTLLILAFTFGAVLGVVATILYRTTP